jgi:hypothetical protein
MMPEPKRSPIAEALAGLREEVDLFLEALGLPPEPEPRPDLRLIEGGNAGKGGN